MPVKGLFFFMHNLSNLVSLPSALKNCLETIYRHVGTNCVYRWMAPESLVDGVFTCQSDVWAFGVLIWEIMTLGQQPYPARTNLEVLHYVRNGGRLGRPNNCPEELYVAKYISIISSLMYKKTVCMIVQDSKLFIIHM